MLNKLFLILSVLFVFSFKNVEKPDFKIRSETLPAIATTFERCLFRSPEEVAIVLSDGSSWRVLNKRADDAYPFILLRWKAGDDIRVKKFDGSKNLENLFIIKNAATSDTYLVKLESDCQNDSAAFFIDRIDQNGYVLVTSAGDEWVISWLDSFTTEKWRPGDRIIINKSGNLKEEDYCLINAFDGSSASGTLVIWF